MHHPSENAHDARTWVPFVQFVMWAVCGMGVGALLLALAYAGTQSYGLVPGTMPGALEIETNPSAPTRALPPGVADLAFVGEVMLGRGVAATAANQPGGFDYFFAECAPYLRDAELALCTLSAPISDAGAPLEDKTYTFRAPPTAIDALANAGFDAAALANRHILDYGAEVVTDMRVRLAEAGIATAGLLSDYGRQEPAILEANGVRIGFLSYCDPESEGACVTEFARFPERPAEGTRANITADIAGLKDQVDIVAVSMHWGPDYDPTPTTQQRDLGRFIIDQGAHIVMGHGPHVQQPADVYNGGIILYSLGNFIFDQHTQPGVLEGSIYRVAVSKDGLADAAWLPMESARGNWQPRPQQDHYTPIPLTTAAPALPVPVPEMSEVRPMARVKELLNHLVREQPPFQYIVPAAAIVIIALYVLIGWWRASFLRGMLAAALLATAAVALWNYTEDHYRQGRYFNAYEHFHYYLGAKYTPEVGYYDLYNAVFVADDETGYPTAGRTVRSLTDHRPVPGQQVLATKEQYKALFSPERWEEFKQDVVFCRSKVSGSLWRRMLNDKGYNATPVWTMIAGYIANQVPTSDWAGMQRLPLIDVAFALAALLLVWWAFGMRAVLLVIIFLGGHYVTSHFTLKAAFMRLDWVMCLVMALCFLRKQWYIPAGLALAYATGARVFPVIFGFGIGAKMLWTFFQTRRLERRYVRFFAAFAGGLAVLVGASLLYGGIGPWREFLGKIAQHNSDISPWRIGFKYVFLVSWNGGAYWDMPIAQAFEEHKALWWSIQGAMLLLSFVLVKKLADDEAFAYGYVPVFFLVAPTYYYHVMLIIPLLFFARRIEHPWRALGLIYLFATGIAGHYYFGLWNRNFNLFFVMSCLLFALVLYLVLFAAGTLFRKQEGPPGDTTDTPEAA
ncbi:MAG: CapA family protein [Candidatus Hydrogenedentota bacterium]